MSIIVDNPLCPSSAAFLCVAELAAFFMRPLSSPLRPAAASDPPVTRLPAPPAPSCAVALWASPLRCVSWWHARLPGIADGPVKPPSLMSLLACMRWRRHPPPAPPSRRRPSQLVFANLGAAYGTAKSGVGIASMGIMHPAQVRGPQRGSGAAPPTRCACVAITRAPASPPCPPPAPLSPPGDA